MEKSLQLLPELLMLHLGVCWWFEMHVTLVAVTAVCVQENVKWV